MQKQLEGTQKILMSSADRAAHIDGQLMQLLHNATTRPAEYKCSVQNRAIHLRMFAGFRFNNISRRHKFCQHRQFFPSNSRMKK